MYVKKTETRVLQGDIIESLPFEFSKVTEEELQTNSITFPFVVVLTQDCDLEWDYKNREKSANEQTDNDKYLQSILICPAYLAEQLKIGEHLKNLGLKMKSWDADLWKPIKRNQNERFHFLPQNPDLGIPELVLDFKHFYTIPRENLYEIQKTKYKISVDILFREDLSQRFANFLSRIGLPVIQTASQQTNTQQAQQV